MCQALFEEAAITDGRRTKEGETLAEGNDVDRSFLR